MIRFARAFAWLRWRITMNSLKSRRRDAWEELSRFGSVLVPVLLGLMLVPTLLAISGGAVAGGLWMARNGASSTVAISIARILLAVATIAAVLAPLVRSSNGVQVNLTRMLLLPIPRRALHFAELTAALTDPWVAVMVPGVLLLPLGMILGGAWIPGLLGILAGLLMLAALAGLGCLVSLASMLLFRDRRRAERVTLVLIVVLSMLGFLPMMVDEVFLDGDAGRNGGAAQPHGTSDAPPAPRDVERMFAWAAPLPSELYARSIARLAEGRTFEGLQRLAGLSLIAVALLLASSAVHRRLLDSPDGGSSARTGERVRVHARRIPGVRASVAAIAAVQVRTALRTVRGKMAVFFNVAFLALIYFVIFPKLAPMGFDPALPIGPLLFLIGVALTLLSLGPLLLNQFAADGAGLTLQLLMPVPVRDLVRGKILGGGQLTALGLAPCLFVAVLLTRDGHVLEWLAAILGGFAAYVAVAPLFAAISAALPKSVDLSRMGKAGNPHPLAGILGLLLTALTMLPPVGLFLAGTMLVRSPAITFGMVAAWTLVAWSLSLPLARMSAETVRRRWDNLLLVASGR